MGEINDHHTEEGPINGRCMYVWKLAPVLLAEMGINNFIRKAKRAKLSGIWVKIADGRSRYRNVNGAIGEDFHSLRRKLKEEGIAVWGWHVPRSASLSRAEQEADLVADLAGEFDLDGILMDAESEDAFFNGGSSETKKYAGRLRAKLTDLGKRLGVSSHDIPSNFPNFPFHEFAEESAVNVPQVYYGGSSSVRNRLDRAIRANSHIDLPFIPVGAGWIGGAGGCGSASACAERAEAFIRLVREHGFPGYSFWHWEGAPSRLWQVLFETSV